MTAEQSVEEQFAAWYKANYGHIAATSSWVERARASYMAGRESTAAQLAEKERELCEAVIDANDAERGEVEQRLRAEAAEQRLQEAQALIISQGEQLLALQSEKGQEWAKTRKQAMNELRQREAELEQLRAQISGERSTS